MRSAPQCRIISPYDRGGLRERVVERVRRLEWEGTPDPLAKKGSGERASRRALGPAGHVGGAGSSRSMLVSRSGRREDSYSLSNYLQRGNNSNPDGYEENLHSEKTATSWLMHTTQGYPGAVHLQEGTVHPNARRSRQASPHSTHPACLSKDPAACTTAAREQPRRLSTRPQKYDDSRHHRNTEPQAASESV